MADLLTEAAGEMTPAQLAIFRRELADRLPGIIEAASQAARGNGNGKGATSMTHNFAPDVRATIRGFGDRRGAVQKNRDLSGQGQERQLKTVQAEIDAYRPKAYEHLRLTWHFIREDYKAWQAKAAQLEAAAGARWDYSRLNYEATAASAALKNATSNTPGGDFPAARQVYEAWTNSGDPHRRRAMLEVGPELLTGRFGATNGAEVNRLAKDASKRLAQELDTPELQALRAEGSNLTTRAAEAYQVTQEVGRLYDPAAGNVWSVGNEFSQLLVGVTLAERVSAETLETTYSLAVIGELPEDTSQEVTHHAH